MNKKQAMREIENHLRKYRTYKAAIKNCERQLNYIYPNITSNFQFNGGGSNFAVTSSTEKAALDRIESKRAIDLMEQRERFILICDSLDAGLAELQPSEQEFCKLRYFEERSWPEIQKALKYSERQLFVIRKRGLEKLLISCKNLFSL